MSRLSVNVVSVIALLFCGQALAERKTRSDKRGSTSASKHEHLRPVDAALDNSTKYEYISLRLAYHNIGEEILTFPGRRPRCFNIMVATFKTWMADLLVQLNESRSSSSWMFDWKRSVAFAMFGLLYIGIAQWFLYVSVLTALFPHALEFSNAPLSAKLHDSAGQMELLGQLLVDNFLICSFIYFPVFYTIKGLMQGGGTVFSRVKIGLSKYRDNIIFDNLCSFALWVPADLIIFSAPMFLRMPLEHATSFGWTAFMSATRGAADTSAKKCESLKSHESKSEATPEQSVATDWTRTASQYGEGSYTASHHGGASY